MPAASTMTYSGDEEHLLGLLKRQSNDLLRQAEVERQAPLGLLLNEMLAALGVHTHGSHEHGWEPH